MSDAPMSDAPMSGQPVNDPSPGNGSVNRASPGDGATSVPSLGAGPVNLASLGDPSPGRPPRRDRSGWRRWTEPTLVRRLLFGQACMLALLWSLAVGAWFAEVRGDDLYGAGAAYAMVLNVAQNLADQPARQYDSLRAIDLALREGYGNRGDPALAPGLLVWQAGRLIYQSDGVPAEIRNTRPGVPETVRAQGQDWRASTRQSAVSDTRVTLVMPGDGWRLWITFNSRGYYLLPLILSMPLLLLPAWLSIRLALRPWVKVGAEIAARGPRDLDDLSFQPRHAELRPLVDSVNALLRRLRASAAREQRFIADAAHELRTPIAALRINAEALQAQGGLTGRQSELLAGMLSSSGRAARLVGQLLRLMRSNAEAPALARTLALDALVQERLAALAGLAQARGVELELAAEAGLVVSGERESLVSMIDNLIDNAIKYSPAAGIVTVRLRRAAGAAVLSVADQGPGIAPALRARVFERFFRDPDQAQTGSGLGLAIAKTAIDRHGGQIELGDADGGRGLLVTVRLPLARDAASPQP